MSIASQLLNRPRQQVTEGVGEKFTATIGRIRIKAEVLWVVFSFALFMVLGPFAAIAVVPAVFSLALQGQDGPEPEPARRDGEMTECRR